MSSSESYTTQWMIGFIITAALIVAALAIGTNVFKANQKTANNALVPDLAQLSKTDPSLVLYEETSSRIDTGFTWAKCIAIGPDDTIYATGGKEVRAFDPTGKRLPLSIELEQDVTAIFIAEDGAIYVAARDTILVFDAKGYKLKEWQSKEANSFYTSIAVKRQNVFAADFGNRTIHHYNTNGNFKNSFGDFVLPSFYFDLALDPAGDFLLAANTGQHRIEKYTFDGTLVSFWGDFSNHDPAKFCGCCNPINFAMLPNNEGLITCEKGITRVKHYNSLGDNFLGYVAGAEAFEEQSRFSAAPDYCFSHLGLDVAVDSQSRVVVLDPASAEIRFYTKKQPTQTVLK